METSVQLDGEVECLAMVISHARKFVFIKIRKTAGTSIEVFLSGVCGSDDVLTPIRPVEQGHCARNFDGFFNHMPAHAIQARVGVDAWDDCFRFCVERNPWDKVVSHFHMVRARENQRMGFDEYLELGDSPVDTGLYTEPGEPRRFAR